MWATLAMTALSLAPAQDGNLELTNVRPTYGRFGPSRKDAASPKLRAPDILSINFDIEGLKASDAGALSFSIGMEITNKDGKVLYREEPIKRTAVNVLGGGRMPGYIEAGVGLDVEPGEYAITAIVNDLTAKTTKKFTRKYEVVKPGFGISNLNLTHDLPGSQEGPPASPVGIVGETRLVNFFVTGFEREKGGKKPSVTVSMRVLSDGKPTAKKDQFGTIKDVPESAKVLPITFRVGLTKPGKYTVELKAVDEVSKKTATQSIDLTVYEIK